MLRLNGLNKGDYQVKIVGATFKRLEALQQDKTHRGLHAQPAVLDPRRQGRPEGHGRGGQGDRAVSGVGGLRPAELGAGAMPTRWSSISLAYLEGVRWSIDPKNKAEAIKLYVDGLKLPEDIAAGLLRRGHDRARQGRRLRHGGLQERAGAAVRHTGSGPLAPEKYVDLSYYKKALAGS